MTRRGATDEALICLQAADRLYTGDLFEDIPAEYADDSERDWCWSKRYWLRDMFFKVQRDAARIHREPSGLFGRSCSLLLRHWPLIRGVKSRMKKPCRSSSRRGGATPSTGSTSSICNCSATLTNDRKVRRSRRPIANSSAHRCAKHQLRSNIPITGAPRAWRLHLKKWRPQKPLRHSSRE